MADGIAAILGEEMQESTAHFLALHTYVRACGFILPWKRSEVQELEKRQNAQRKAINTTCEQLQRLRVRSLGSEFCSLAHHPCARVVCLCGE